MRSSRLLPFMIADFGWRAVSWLIACLLVTHCSLVSSVRADNAYPVAKPLEQGWDWSLEMGALATFGVTNTSAVSFSSDVTFRNQALETESGLKFYRSTSESIVSESVSGDGSPGDQTGISNSRRVKTVTNDRRYLFIQPRWFFSSRHYLFGMFDHENNTPADIDTSMRQIAGLGYRLHYHDSNTISAAVGIGNKTFQQVSEPRQSSSIAYLAIRFDRHISDQLKVKLTVNSDFGANNRFSEIESVLKWQMNKPVALKLKYEARFNSNIANPVNTFSDGFEGSLSAYIEIDIF